MGLKRYKRLIFGSSSASIRTSFKKSCKAFPQYRNISDDIIVFGKTQELHNQQLQIVISRLAEKGLTLNCAKSVFRASELVFFEHKISAAFISPDERKVNAVM